MRYLTLLLALLFFAASAAADDYIVIVLDTSGSMGDRMDSGDTRMVVAQNALIEVLSKVPDTTRVGILSFEGWAYDIQEVNRARLTQAIRATRSRGGTPLYEYLRLGGTRLLQERQKQGNVGFYKIIVVTDGEANDEPLNSEGTFRNGTRKPGVLEDIMSRSLVVDTIGLDMSGDHSLKELINGQYMSGDDPETLTQAVQKALAEVGYGDSKDTAEDAFAELSDLPDEFFVVANKALTTYQNHPIGEMPPVVTITASGEVTQAPIPATVEVPELGEEGIGFGTIMMIGVVILVAVVGLILLSGRRGTIP